jgi:hypothetical protein
MNRARNVVAVTPGPAPRRVLALRLSLLLP